MLQNILAAQLGVGIGTFTIHLGSSHLYDRDRDLAKKILDAPGGYRHLTSPVLTAPPPRWLNDVLTREIFVVTNEVDPWLSYGRVLTAGSNIIALEHLKKLSD
jgi:hypothetical protein